MIIYEELFANTDKKPLCELSAEELKIVVSANSNKDHVLDCWDCTDIESSQGCWYTKQKYNNQNYHDKSIYRVKRKVEVKSLAIPWELIDKKWQYAAMDENGSVWFYSEMPYIDPESELPSVWVGCFFITEGSSILKINTEGVHWKYSLTKRP